MGGRRLNEFSNILSSGQKKALIIDVGAMAAAMFRLC
jgi:hypothetical protein